MNIYEDSSSDTESISPLESGVREYVDSDKADSDIEIELYSQIHYTEDISASTLPIESILNDSSCIEVSPIKSADLLPDVNSKEELGLNAQKEMPRLIKFNSFESSTPKDILNSDLIIKNTRPKNTTNVQMKLPKAKRKRNAISSPTNSKLEKNRNDSGCSESLFSDDDTDDNSVICLDSDDHCDSSSMLMNIKDHIHGELILLDSTATSDESDKNSVFLNLSEDSEDSLKLSSATLSVTNKSGNLWHIDHEDRFAHIKKQKRYHEKHNSICNNCKKKGHLSKDCQEPSNMRCYICGGEHGWSGCHQRVCGICFNYGHGSRKCKFRACDVLCSLCKMRGHHMPECPDIWRRYHLTTSPDVIVKGSKEVSQGVKKYCYNCGHQGHYGHECLRPRMSPESFPTWPFIISYKDPSQHFKKYLKRGNKEHSAGSGKHHDSHPGHKHNKKHRSQADKLRDMISEFSEKQSESSRKSKGKQKNKKHLKVHKYSHVFKGNDFPRSALGVNLDDDDHKSERRKKREMHRMYAFMRKKQKLHASI